MVKINVANLAHGNLDHEDGSRLYHVVRSALRNGDEVELDFSNMDIVTSSFMNTSFRLLFRDYDYTDLKTRLKIRNSNSFINKMIREYAESALRQTHH